MINPLLIHLSLLIQTGEENSEYFVMNEYRGKWMIWIETQRGIYRVHERQEGKGNPRIGDDYFTLNTPSQMQRECNGVAFGE